MAKENEAMVHLFELECPLVPLRFARLGSLTRGGGGGCVNGVSTYSRSEVQIERKVTMRRSIRISARNFDPFFEKIRMHMFVPLVTEKV